MIKSSYDYFMILDIKFLNNFKFINLPNNNYLHK